MNPFLVATDHPREALPRVSRRSVWLGPLLCYVASALRWRLALDRQAAAIDQFVEETGIAPDPAEYRRALKALGG